MNKDHAKRVLEHHLHQKAQGAVRRALLKISWIKENCPGFNDTEIARVIAAAKGEIDEGLPPDLPKPLFHLAEDGITVLRRAHNADGDFLGDLTVCEAATKQVAPAIVDAMNGAYDPNTIVDDTKQLADALCTELERRLVMRPRREGGAVE